MPCDTDSYVFKLADQAGQDSAALHLLLAPGYLVRCYADTLMGLLIKLLPEQRNQTLKAPP